MSFCSAQGVHSSFSRHGASHEHGGLAYYDRSFASRVALGSHHRKRGGRRRDRTADRPIILLHCDKFKSGRQCQPESIRYSASAGNLEIVPSPVIETNPQFFYGTGDGSDGYYSEGPIYSERPGSSSK